MNKPDCTALDVELTKKLIEVADYIIKQGTTNTYEGNWIITFDEIPSDVLGVDMLHKHQDSLCDLLFKHQEVADVVISGDTIDVVYYLDFCPNVEQEEIDDDNTEFKCKPSILAQLQEGKKSVAQNKDPSKTAPKRDSEREV